MRALSLITVLLLACSSPNIAGNPDGGNISDPNITTPTTGPVAMPLINRGTPSFASAGDPKAASDDNPASAWGTNMLPAWIAYDLSATPSESRQKIMLTWNAIHAGGFLNDPVQGYQALLVDYTVETNTAPGGTLPTIGWETAATVAGNSLGTVEHLLNIHGANWVRLNITKGTTDGIGVDVDIYGAPNGASDAWMFMGDSITYMTMTYAFNNLPSVVHAQKADRWPAVIDAALGGTNTGTATLIIDATVAAAPSRFVVLAYGTNDHAKEFHMEELVQKVIAAGRIPVVPHMPWSSGSMEGTQINAQIDALYVKYPQILRGPDLWAVFMNRTDLIPMGDVHPNSAGQDALRKAWADVMAAQP